jgi:hypothetical protein
VSGLATLQRAFRAAVLGASDDGLEGTFRTPRGGAQGRLAIYRNTVQASLAEVLAAAFPVVRRIVGGAFFDELCRRYITANPPRRPQLSAYGADLPEFIAANAALAELPYLADTARVEWARGEAYFAADAVALDPAALTRIAEDRLADSRLMLHPALRLVRSRFPVAKIWRINQPENAEVPRIDMGAGEAVLVSRPQARVILREIGKGDAAFVAAIEAGATLGGAVEHAQQEDPDFAFADALRDHLINGSFTSVSCP